jgi:trk system potassium uptake protein TrkA
VRGARREATPDGVRHVSARHIIGRMHIVIVGGGEIGFALAQALLTEHEVFVIDHAPDVGRRFEPIDVQFVSGPGASAEVLDRAGISKADVLVACTGLDEVNIVVCGVARQLGSPRTICFVSREDFLGLQEQKGLSPFGIDRVMWPEAQLAEDIERIIREPGAIDAEDIADGAIRLVEYRLDPGAPLAGRRIADLNLPRESLVVAVRRGESFFIPRGDSELAAGDRAVLMGTPAALQGVTRLLGAAEMPRQRVTIIGGGDVGFRIAQRLDEHGDFNVTIIERDSQRGALLASHLQHALVLNGDGTDLELLEAEDISRSDVVVSVIDNDERNLFASLLARQLGVKRVITRVGKRANVRLFERVGIDIAISARGAAVASVLHQIQGGAARLLAVIEQGAGRILEIDVPADYEARALREIQSPRDSIVGAILRPGRVIVPRGGDQVQPGDRLIVFSTEAAADRVRDFFTART